VERGGAYLPHSFLGCSGVRRNLSLGTGWARTMTKVVVHSIENGPNLILIDGKADVAFCRCGHSEHKPLCDGTHQKVKFRAPAAKTVILE
jgi:CDGSH-type Zn-finger protein